MGMPRGLARRSSTPAEKKLAAAVYVAAVFRKSLLESSDIDASSFQQRVR
jgi:hypothetical protein